MLRKHLRYAMLVMALAAGLVMVDPHVSAAPDHQIQCDDGTTVTVSSQLLALWPNTDFCQFTIEFDEVFSGGVPRDGITPIYPDGYVYPDYITRLGGQRARYHNSYQTIAEGNEWLVDQSPVIAVEVKGDARAYPLGVLTRHEIANTFIGGVPVAVTFCPLCNSAIVFDRRLGDRELHFGVSGFLRNSDLIMWDHETESWWQQAIGEGIVGELAGEELSFITSSTVSWADFKAAYPNGQVFVPIVSDSGAVAGSYDYNPYAGYDSDETPFLYFGEVDSRLSAVERVLGYETRDDDERVAIAYPFQTLQEEIVINDEVAGEPVVVFWQPGAVSALDSAAISDAREVGSANIFDPRLDDGTLLTFVADGDIIRDEQTNSAWNIFGEAIEGELSGTQLFQLRGVSHFWFAWSAFYPETTVWGIDG